VAKKHYGAEEARAMLPELLDRAHHGGTTVITKRGKAYAALVPVDQARPRRAAGSLLSLEGSGVGLWGRKSAVAIAKLRDEWP
jgi:prevent-host-death family protein